VAIHCSSYEAYSGEQVSGTFRFAQTDAARLRPLSNCTATIAPDGWLHLGLDFFALDKVERSSSAVRSEATITAPRATDGPEFPRNGILDEVDFCDGESQVDESRSADLC
jgi:hypothetical protein